GNKQVRGLDTSRFPVESVSWNSAVEFCCKLSELPEEKGKGWTYRLPIEAEWEYACQGGPFPKLPTLAPKLNRRPRRRGERRGAYRASLHRTSAVGSEGPSILGLYDMHGNVREWCQSRHGTHPLARGSAWNSSGRDCSTVFGAYSSYNSVGFRVVC